MVVTAPIKEVELVGDTTVINADAYRIPEGSNLEELVKKIPGLEYDRQNKPWFIMGFPLRKSMLTGKRSLQETMRWLWKICRRFGKQDKSV